MPLTTIEKQQIANNARTVHSKLYSGVPIDDIAGKAFSDTEDKKRAVIGSLMSHYYGITPFQGYAIVDHQMKNLWPDSTYDDVIKSFRESKTLPESFPRKSQLIEAQKAIEAQRVVAGKYQGELNAIRDKIVTEYESGKELGLVDDEISQEKIDSEAMLQFKLKYKDLDQSIKDELSLGSIKPFEKTTLGVSMYDMVEAGLSQKSMADYVAKSTAQIERIQSDFLKSERWQKEAQAVSELPWFKEKKEKATRALAQSMLSIGSATMRGLAAASGNQWEYAQNLSKTLYQAQAEPGLAFDREDVMDWGITVAYQVLPVMGLGVAASMANPVLGTSLIGLMEYNDAYWTEKEKGASELKANTIGLAVGIINGAIEQASGGGGKYLKLANKAANRLSNSPKLLKALDMGMKPAELLETAVHEGLEEMSQGAVSMLFTDTAPRDENGNIDMTALSSSLAEQGLLGMVGSVAMAGISTSTRSVFGGNTVEEIAQSLESVRYNTETDLIKNAEQISGNKLRFNIDSRETADTIIAHYANKADLQGYGIKADIDLGAGTLDIEVIEGEETIKTEKEATGQEQVVEEESEVVQLSDDYTPAEVDAKDVLSRPELEYDEIASALEEEVDNEVEADDANTLPPEEAQVVSEEEQRQTMIKQMADIWDSISAREKDLWPDKPRVYQGKDLIEDLKFKEDPQVAYDYMQERIAEFGREISKYSLQEAKERWVEIEKLGRVFTLKIPKWSTFAKSRGRTKFTVLGNGEFLNTTVGSLLNVKYDDLAVSQIMAEGDKQFRIGVLSKAIANEINSKTDYEKVATEEIFSWENALFSKSKKKKTNKKSNKKTLNQDESPKPAPASVFAKRFINKNFPKSNKALKSKLLKLVEPNTMGGIQVAIQTTLAERDRFEYKKYRKKVQKLLPIVKRAMRSTGAKGMDDKLYGSLKTFLDTFSYEVPDVLSEEMLNVLTSSIEKYLDSIGLVLPDGVKLREALSEPSKHEKDIELLKEWVSPQIMEQLEDGKSKIQAFKTSSPALMKYAYELLRNAISVNSRVKRQISTLEQANVERDIHSVLREISTLKDRREGKVGDRKSRSLWRTARKLGWTNEKFGETLAYQLGGAKRNTVLMKLLHESRLDIDDEIIMLTNDISSEMRKYMKELDISFDDVLSVTEALDYLPKDLNKLGIKIGSVKPTLIEQEVVVGGKLLEDGKLPAGKLINLYMLLRQEDSYKDIRSKGIALNGDVVASEMTYDEAETIREAVEGNALFMKFVNLIDRMYQIQYEINNKTHQRLFQGTRLPEIENYVPIYRLGYMGVGAKRNVIPTPAEYFRHLQERTGGGQPIIIEDAFSNMIHNMTNSIVVSATAEQGRLLKAVFGDDSRIQEELKKRGYEDESRAINALANMVAGQKLRGNDIDSIMNTISRGLVRSTLSSFGVIGGQVFSYVGYYSFTSRKYLNKINYAPKHVDVTRARQICPLLHISFMGFGMAKEIDDRLSPSALRGWVGEDKAFVDTTLKPISVVDAYTKYQAFLIAEAEMNDPELSGVALEWYNSNGINPLAMKYDGKEYRSALNKRTRYLINATQPTSGYASQVANSELAGDGMGQLLMFRSYVRKPLNVLMQAIVNYENGNIDKTMKPLNEVIANTMLSFTLYSIFRHLLDIALGKDKEAKDLLASILTAPANLIPIIGYPTKQAVSNMLTGKYATADVESISLAFVGDVSQNLSNYYRAAHYLFSDETMSSGKDKGKQKRAVYFQRATTDTVINTMKFYGVPRPVVDVVESARYKKAEPKPQPKKVAQYKPRSYSTSKKRKYVPPMR